MLGAASDLPDEDVEAEALGHSDAALLRVARRVLTVAQLPGKIAADREVLGVSVHDLLLCPELAAVGLERGSGRRMRLMHPLLLEAGVVGVVALVSFGGELELATGVGLSRLLIVDGDLVPVLAMERQRVALAHFSRHGAR